VEVLLERHGVKINLVKQQALDLFAPLGPTYDRYANLLSFGQDPRWRRFLVSRIEAGENDTILDVATGTAAVAMELTRRTGCRVVGLDQSEEMLAEGRRRISAAGLTNRIELVQGRAEQLPFADESFAGLTFTYLLRYVNDPAATVGELARVVRPGGTIGMLEFGLPRGIARPAWELWVRAGLPAAGALISPGWREVGSFLGPSIRDFHRRHDVLELWRAAGIENVQMRRLSLGGGLVLWGRKP
jgi:demethylmenaquinone methyltransferase / 2-methoxy-6-polyprenyl-1,4-benzoquinol methylase